SLKSDDFSGNTGTLAKKSQKSLERGLGNNLSSERFSPVALADSTANCHLQQSASILGYI
ncbi:MAG: hypothetical protein IJR91_05530, partial [Ruminococcus sp.]|nr:hypothetical protein [Ruminococcus sp.]